MSLFVFQSTKALPWIMSCFTPSPAVMSSLKTMYAVFGSLWVFVDYLGFAFCNFFQGTKID